jgi:xylulose-5-phosphate/fructose-6-phosphate phosphoketolase
LKTISNTLTPDLFRKMDAYWRAVHYLSAGQIYLYHNPLLKRPLTIADVKHMLLGHWDTGKTCLRFATGSGATPNE